MSEYILCTYMQSVIVSVSIYVPMRASREKFTPEQYYTHTYTYICTSKMFSSVTNLGQAVVVKPQS